MERERIPVAAVVGPTASGKTALAAELALRFGGEVISADSMQIYRGLPVSTAQPTKEEMRGVPHHLIAFLDWGQPFSVADYVTLAAAAIRDVHARGRLPVIAGGTGLYVSSLLHHISFSDPFIFLNCTDFCAVLCIQTYYNEFKYQLQAL